MPRDALLAEQESEQAVTGGRRAWTVAVMCAAVGLVMCMVTTVSTALPVLAVGLGASQTQQTWIVDAYTVVLAALVLPAGALGDRYGRRGMLVAGLVLFALSCAVPVAVDSVSLVIASRAVTGLGAALVMPSTLSLITASFLADGRGRAIGIWAGIAGLGGMLGIFMTGLILQHYSWHGVFLVPAVLAVALAIAGCTVRPSRERVARPLDLPGAGLSALAVGALISGILQSADDGWGSPVVIGALVAAVVLGAVFIWTELRRAHPMLDMRLFGNRALTLGSMSMIVQFIAAFGAIYGVTQYLQLVLGYSPLVSGLALWPVAVSMMPLAVVSAYLAERIGLRLVTGAGLAVVVAGTVLVGRLGPHSPYLSTAIAVAVLGAGIGLAGPAGTAAIMDNIPADSYGVGSAINDVTREIGAALGIALAGSIMSSGYTHRMTAAAAALPPGARHAVTSSIATALPVAARLAGPGRAVADAARAAFCHGMWISSAAIAGVVAVGAIAALLVRTPARPRRPES